MNSRHDFDYIKEVLLPGTPEDIVDLTLTLLPKLQLTDLQNLIMQAELEIDYRRHKLDESE